MNCSTVIYIEITEKTCFNCIYLPIAALVRYQAGSTTLNRFRLNQEGKTIKTKAGSLNIPWCGDWFYFHQGLLTSVYARSSTYLFTQFQRSWPEGYTRINWKGVEGQESYVRKTQIPYPYYNLLPLSLSFSLSSLLL